METLRGLSLAQIRELARDFGKKFSRKGGVIGLTGSLGSGKTTFVKSFAKAFGITRIKSPTFIVAAKYQTKLRSFYHLDLYRLDHKRELAHLGLGEILSNPKNVVVIEWADKFPSIEDKCDLVINFKIKTQNRRDVAIKYN